MHSPKTDKILNSKEFKQREQKNFEQLRPTSRSDQDARLGAFHLTVRQYVAGLIETIPKG